MSNNIIEKNIHFQEELCKMLDEESEDEDNICQITREPLKDKFVTLKCNHHFNYEALFKEIYKQKYELNTYKIIFLNDNDKKRFIRSKQDFFIKCPYCRHIQFSILPYYEEFGFNQYYGINSLDKSLPIPITLHDYENNYIENPNYKFCLFNKTFSIGTCFKVINEFGDTCKNKFVTNIQNYKKKNIDINTNANANANTNTTFCKFHYEEELKNYKIKEKMFLKQEKEKLIQEKKKQLEIINEERSKIGLKPLKRFPNKTKQEKKEKEVDKIMV
jgi:hypothetical protein